MKDKKNLLIKIKKIFYIVVLILLVYLFIWIVFTPTGSHLPKTPELTIIESVIEPEDPIKFKNNLGNICMSLLTEEEIKPYSQELKNKTYQESLKLCLSILEKAEKKSPFEIKRISDMNVPRINSDTIKLNNGDVLILGGNSGNKISVELFNSKNNRFKLIEEDIKRHIPKNYNCKHYCKPLLLPDNTVFYMGSVYNPDKKQFQKPESEYARKIIDYDKKLSSRNLFTKNNTDAIEVFSNGEVLLGLNCSDSNYNKRYCKNILLYNPFNSKNYKSGKIHSDRNVLEAKYINKNVILLIEENNNTNNKLKKHIELYNPNKGITSLLNCDITFSPNMHDYNYYIFRRNTHVSDTIMKQLYKQLENFQLLYLENDNIFMPINLKLFNSFEGIICNIKNDSKATIITIPNYTRTIYSIKNEFILFVSESALYILDLNNNSTSTIVNPNLSLIGQSFVPLNNEEILITGGKITISHIKRSKYAAILTKK